MISHTVVQTLTLAPNILSILTVLWAAKCHLQTNYCPFGFKLISTQIICNLFFNIAMICYSFNSSENVSYTFKFLQSFSLLWTAITAITIFSSLNSERDEKTAEITTLSFWLRFIPCLLLTVA